MKRSVLCLCVIVLLVVFSVPSFAASGPAFKVGVVFTSDTLDIPDSLSDLVTGLFSNALSRFTNISIVNQYQIKSASNSLGFNQTHLSTPKNLKAVGERAGVNFMVWTRINYDVKEAAKAEASRILGKFLKQSKDSLTKHLKPDFDVRVVDVSSAKIVFNNKFNLDIFSSSMKDQLLAGMLSGNSLSAGSLDTSVIRALADKLAPLMQTLMNEAALLAVYKDTGNTEGIISTVTDLAKGKTHDTKTVAQKSAAAYVGEERVAQYVAPSTPSKSNSVKSSTTQKNTTSKKKTKSNNNKKAKSKKASTPPTNAIVKFESKSTDPATVIKGYGLSAKQKSSLINKHKDALQMRSKKEKSERYRSLFKQYKLDYLAAYCIALVEFEMGHGGESVKWCNKALSINSQYSPAKQLLKRAKGL